MIIYLIQLISQNKPSERNDQPGHDIYLLALLPFYSVLEIIYSFYRSALKAFRIFYHNLFLLPLSD